MGQETAFKPVKLFFGLIYRNQNDCERIKWVLEDQLSSIDFESPEIPFDCTDYYSEEMGSPLYRKFVSVSELIFPQRLADIKLFTNRLERETSVDGKRILNLDPGFLSLSNVIIATTKDYYHRVPMNKGIYAHIEYIFVRKALKTLEWSYPDFHKDEYRDFFTKLRVLYKENLKKSNWPESSLE